MLKLVPTFRRRLLIPMAIFLAMMAGCAVTPPPLTGLIAGRQIETLQSDISVSLKQGEETHGARGYLVYQRPDRFHLALLSPFGQSLAEVYSWDDKLTCIFPGDRIAYSGTIKDLPDQQGARLWGLMQWVVDLHDLGMQPEGEREIVSATGSREKMTFDGRGLLKARVSEEGDQVVYDDYRNVAGIAFPLVVELRDNHKNRIKLTFDDPEINRPVEKEALIPRLDKVQVFPLTFFKGF